MQGETRARSSRVSTPHRLSLELIPAVEENEGVGLGHLLAVARKDGKSKTRISVCLRQGVAGVSVSVCVYLCVCVCVCNPVSVRTCDACGGWTGSRPRRTTDVPHALKEARLCSAERADGVDDEDKDVGVTRSGVDPLVKVLAVVQARRVEDHDVVLEQAALVPRPVHLNLVAGKRQAAQRSGVGR